MISSTDKTFVARFSADEKTARHIADLLGENLEHMDVAAAAFEETNGRWLVELYCRENLDRQEIFDAVVAVAGEAAAQSLTHKTIVDRNWVAASLEGLKPVEAGCFIVHGQHDRSRIKPNRIAIEIEAALAFGTGHHGTTRGCLLALDRITKSRQPRRIVDIGTGTGVLAIAAARRLRRPVFASDIDPQAVVVARKNTQQNRAGAFVSVVCAAGTTEPRFAAHAPFHLAFANILLGPLKRLANPIVRLLAPNARLVLSGLLRKHANAALAAYRSQGLVLESRIELEGWVTLVLARPARISVQRSKSDRPGRLRPGR
ncbi:MAG TPA: 50S ribosomal protein L11 methyltransferase [Xanthobacteraceae bacterium]|nr:50S ribosomal protein L11 methyltransferase [Xanthobacteraceae bacterium]